MKTVPNLAYYKHYSIEIGLKINPETGEKKIYYGKLLEVSESIITIINVRESEFTLFKSVNQGTYMIDYEKVEYIRVHWSVPDRYDNTIKVPQYLDIKLQK